METRQDVNKTEEPSNEKNDHKEPKCSNLEQNMPKIMQFFSTTLCHGNCHSSTKISHGVSKLETCVLRMSTEVLLALNQPKQSSDGQDTIFLSK